MNLLQAALLTVYPALLIIAALTDATSFTIPNRISLLLLAAYFPTALVLGRPLGEVGIDLAVFIAALVVAMGMFAAGWIGGGDAKLFAVASLWLGWAAAPAFLVVTALAGAALAVILLNLRSSWVKPLVDAGPDWVVRLATPKAAVPYGVAIAAGGLAAFPHSALFQAFHGSF